MIFTILNIFLLFFAICTIAGQNLSICGRRKRQSSPKISKPSNIQISPNLEDKKIAKASSSTSSSSHKVPPPADTPVDKTQDVDQFAQANADQFSNVNLLGPTLGGCCNDDNAATEAKNRHITNQFFPKYQIQKTSIKDKMTEAEIKKMVAALPKHPPVRFRAKAPEYNEKNDQERREKWKDVHVTWNPIGPVYIVRSRDISRSKDDAVQDTVDSPDGKSQEGSNDGVSENEQINSEMPMSEGNKTQVSKDSRRKGRNTMTTSTQASSGSEKVKKKEDKNLERTLREKPTQEDTILDPPLTLKTTSSTKLKEKTQKAIKTPKDKSRLYTE